MRLEKLSLYNFKNYREVQLEFNGNIQCFLGKNGSGKTNLLDAIYYLSFTKSAINSSDQQTILTGENHFLIRGEFARKGEPHRVVCSFQQGQKKIIREDDQDCTKLSTHIGKYPVCVRIAGLMFIYFTQNPHSFATCQYVEGGELYCEKSSIAART